MQLNSTAGVRYASHQDVYGESFLGFLSILSYFSSVNEGSLFDRRFEMKVRMQDTCRGMGVTMLNSTVMSTLEYGFDKIGCSCGM